MIPVILSGGSGTRLWPLSRENYPKPFLKSLFSETLMEQALKRVSNLESPLIITTENLKTLTEKELKRTSIEAQCLFEPFGKNTAAAIALLCHHLCQKGQTDQIVAVFPADQLIENEDHFKKSLHLAEEKAQKGVVVTLGIQPTFAATGYGYIETQDSSSDVLPVQCFHEKPPLEKAQDYLAQGNFYWNAGIFVFKVETMITHLQNLAEEIWSKITSLKSDLSNISEIYQSLPSISIDYAIMEKLSEKELACIPSDLGWSDVGSWDAVCDVTKKQTFDQTIEVSSSNNHVFSSKNKVYSLNGVSDLIVVDSDDALLISRKGQTENIKQTVETLKKQNDSRTTDHNFEHRPWGQYEVLKDTDHFKSKVITIDSHSQISYQSHEKREEHWIVTRGCGEVVLNDEVIPVKKGSYIHIPLKSKHRIRNTQESPLEFVEVQLGSYFGEDDITRYEDDYQRK